MKQSDIDCHGA